MGGARTAHSNLPAVPPGDIRRGLLFNRNSVVMLKWALIFFVVSIVAGFLGFSGVSAATAGIAKILFVLALILVAIFLVLGLAVVA
jgi:uncharacterized membrane protein YtjA (UPF0391 family)